MIQNQMKKKHFPKMIAFFSEDEELVHNFVKKLAKQNNIKLNSVEIIDFTKNEIKKKNFNNT